jgi:hypothetical protein
MKTPGAFILSASIRMKFSGIREAEYETLKMFRSSFTRKEYAEAYQALVKREVAAQKQAAKRAAITAAREAAREAELEAAYLKKEAEREAKRQAARIARNLKAKQARKYSVHAQFKFFIMRKMQIDSKTVWVGPFELLPRDKFFETFHADINTKTKEEYETAGELMQTESDIEVVWALSSYKVVAATKVVSTTVAKTDVKMKQAGSLFLDGEEQHEFDTGEGTCVFDWIIQRYGAVRGCIKMATKESLTKILGSEALENGVSVTELNAVCDVLCCRQYALDETNAIIHTYVPKRLNNNVPPLVYRVKNGHFYPIVKEATSICQMGRATNQAQKGKEEVKEAKTLEVVMLSGTQSKYEQIVKICKEQKLEVYGRGAAPLRYSDDGLVSFELNGKLYLWEEDEMIKATQKIYELNELPYDGATIPSMITKQMNFLNLNEKSALNPHAMAVLSKAKNRVHYGRLQPSGKDEWAADIIKCYSSCLMNPVDDWYIFSSIDEWKPWDQELKPGLYFVETNDMRLFHGSNVYSLAIIERARKAGISYTIRSQLRPSKVLPKTYFNGMIEDITYLCRGDISLMKWFFNIFVGMLGKSTHASINARMDTDVNTVWTEYNADKPGKPFITSHDGYYFYGRNHKIELAEHNLPMWLQILDWSNIKLFDLISEVESTGGVLVGRKTDCAVFVGGSVQERLEVGGVRLCDVPDMKEMKPAEHRALSSYICETDDWDTSPISTSSQINEATDAIMANGGALLTGYAGTGKTYMAKGVADLFVENFDGPVLRMAPTNKAALNIGGRTIHKELAIDMKGKFNLKGLRRKYSGKRVLILLDEASMIGSQLWRKLVELKKALPLSVWLILGDEGQCRPVGEETMNFFESSMVKYLAANLKINLTEIQRYDPKLAELALAIRSGLSFEKRRGRVMAGRHLCYFNNTRQQLNYKLNEKRGVFVPCGTTGEGTQDAYLYSECPVIAYRNYSKGGKIFCVNAEQFVIRSVTAEKLVVACVRPEGEHVWDLPTEDFHHWFHLNFASTVHKSQGDTISGPVTIWDHEAMDARILYTAVTRAKAMDQIYFA